MDTKVNKGKTEIIEVPVEGAVFSEFPGTKVNWWWHSNIYVVLLSELISLVLHRFS